MIQIYNLIEWYSSATEGAKIWRIRGLYLKSYTFVGSGGPWSLATECAACRTTQSASWV